MKHTDSRKAYDLTESELVNSDLATLASKAGYASLRAMLNDLNMWSAPLAEVQEFLADQINAG